MHEFEDFVTEIRKKIAASVKFNILLRNILLNTVLVMVHIFIQCDVALYQITLLDELYKISHGKYFIFDLLRELERVT